jgi:hypothetical protein
MEISTKDCPRPQVALPRGYIKRFGLPTPDVHPAPARLAPEAGPSKTFLALRPFVSRMAATRAGVGMVLEPSPDGSGIMIADLNPNGVYRCVGHCCCPPVPGGGD